MGLTTGQITGTPSSTGSAQSFTVSAVSSLGGNAVTRAFTWTVNAPTTSWVSPADGSSIGTFTSGTAISPVQLTATATAGTVQYTVTAGALPTGLSLGLTTGQITGTPTQTGSAVSFTVSAVSSLGGSAATRSFTWTVNTGVSYLVVAGGGGGGNYTGGGGAGGLLAGTAVLAVGTTYTILVGAGGGGSSSQSAAGSSGANSSISGSGFSTVTTVGGGGGGSVTPSAGQAGGSGGGGGGGGGTGGAKTCGQGNNGGAGRTDSNTYTNGGGGGGAGAAGATGGITTAGAGAGGVGVSSSISGTATYYAGGGGGGYTGNGAIGAGGNGGGGAGGSGNGVSGTANLGGGGGGAGNATGGNGGSGVVVVSYAGCTPQFSGGAVTLSGGNVIHTFRNSGYLTGSQLLTKSLRFRRSASAYLNKSFASSGSLTTWTYSTWLKRGALGISCGVLSADAASGSSNGTNGLQFKSDDTLQFYLNNYSGTQVFNIQTTQVFRDPSAWYHIVLTYDSTNATSSNRIRLYINGSQVTAFSTTTYPSSSQATYINQTGYTQTISKDWTSGYFDGEMTQVNFIDGQALTPNYFGTFNQYGVWQPIAYAGTYGTNGFYLPFTNTTSTTTLGYDSSGNSNNWTVNNISLTAGATYDSMTDVPTLTSATAANYCVLNAVNKGSNINLTNGNLQYDNVTSDASVFGTIGMSSGKFYWEMTVTSAGCSCGIAAGNLPSSAPGSSATGYAYNYDGRKVNNGSLSAYGASYAVGDVIGYAFDADAGTITCYKNNTSQGTMFSGLTSGPYFAAAGNGGSGAAYNFGQQGFKYTPPSGFVALNTYNM